MAQQRDPTYRLQHQSGQGVVTLRDPVTARRRDVLLGEHGKPASHAEYARAIQAWNDAGLLNADNQLVENPDFRGMPGKLSESFRPFSTEIEKILIEQRIEHHVRPDKPRTRITLNKTLLDHPAFKAKWDKVSRKSRTAFNWTRTS